MASSDNSVSMENMDKLSIDCVCVFGLCVCVWCVRVCVCACVCVCVCVYVNIYDTIMYTYNH